MEKKYRVTLLVASLLAPLSLSTYGASFQILEQSPAQLGKAFAGTASDISDASSVFFNPAAITQLERTSFSIGGNAILATAEFNNTNSNTNGIPSETDEIGYVPNIYLVAPLSDTLALGSKQLTLGLGINVSCFETNQ